MRELSKAVCWFGTGDEMQGHRRPKHLDRYRHERGDPVAEWAWKIISIEMLMLLNNSVSECGMISTEADTR